MGYTIDPSFKNYKVFRLKLAAEQVKGAKVLPPSFMNLLAADPGLMQEKPEPHVYRCRKCRRIVASKSNLITHTPKDQENSYDSPVPKRREKLESSQKYLNFECQEEPGNSLTDGIVEITDQVMAASISDKSLTNEPQICKRTFFVEPMTWMKEVVHNVEGKLYCPSCKGKIGSFNWAMASKCPCGAQVSPSFYLVPSRIEYSNIVQNMQQVTV
jgi:dual specificity phosphatase 12